MTEEDIKHSLVQYIVKETKSDAKNITGDTLLFEQGIFDSIGLLLLIEFIKEEYKVTTNDDDLVIENFESVNSISKYIINKIKPE